MSVLETTKSVLKKTGKTTVIVAAVGAGVYGLSYLFGKVAGKELAEVIDAPN